MREDVEIRPGVEPIFLAAVFISLSAARVASSWSTGSRRLLFEFGIWVIAAEVGLWGWLRLRRAKADRPDLTWWQFLQADLISLGILTVLMSVFAVVPHEQLDGFFRSLWEFLDLLHIARGHAL